VTVIAPSRKHNIFKQYGVLSRDRMNRDPRKPV
jgi:hypothetical protein